MASLLDLLLPQRLITRAFDDLHRIGDAAVSLAGLADAIRYLRTISEEATAARAAIDSISHDVTILRDEFGRANDEIARLRETFGPQLEALRRSAEGLHRELELVRREVGALAHEADEITDVVEPLQTATERVGRFADRLPGRNR